MGFHKPAMNDYEAVIIIKFCTSQDTKHEHMYPLPVSINQPDPDTTSLYYMFSAVGAQEWLGMPAIARSVVWVFDIQVP